MTKTAVPHFSGILGSDAFPIEAARYRLIWSEICPWSQRVAILRRLLGLEDIISEGKVNPVITEKGWQFSLDEGHRDPILDVDYVMAIYKKTELGQLAHHRDAGEAPLDPFLLGAAGVELDQD